ncbi:MAG: DUF2336 domain-containing protein, partial [Hyphomicrobiales bacterium]
MINSLMTLAEEGTDAAMGALFVKLCEYVVSDIDERSDQELTLFAEVVLKLYGHASEKDKLRLSKKLASSEKTPGMLATRIAEDNVSVALPILSESPVFAQQDLIDLIERLSNDHLQAIARRPDLSTEVSNALVKKGNKPVHRILAGNRAIQLSRESMMHFVKLAAEDMMLCDELVSRTDLTPTACRDLMPLVNDEAKKQLQKVIQGSLSQDQLEEIARLKELRQELGRALNNTDIKLLWSDADRLRISVDDLTILLLQDGRFNHVIELLADRGRIAKSSLKDAVFSGKKDIVLRTAARSGIKLHTFSLFVKVRCEHLKIPMTQGSDWIAAYTTYLKNAKGNGENRGGDFQAKRKDKSAS